MGGFYSVTVMIPKFSVLCDVGINGSLCLPRTTSSFPERYSRESGSYGLLPETKDLQESLP